MRVIQIGKCFVNLEDLSHVLFIEKGRFFIKYFIRFCYKHSSYRDEVEIDVTKSTEDDLLEYVNKIKQELLDCSK